MQVKHALNLSLITAMLGLAGCASQSYMTQSVPPISTVTPAMAAPTPAPAIGLRGAETPAIFDRAEAPSLPLNAKPGECYARIVNQPRYETRTETMLKTAASEKLEVMPARYEDVEQTVMVKPASKRFEYVPATYETVQEQMMIKPATKRLEQVPAVYETVEEKVLMREAYMAWKKGISGSVTKVDETTGDILCLVEVPAEYRTVTKQVLKSPVTTREIEEPAEFRTVSRQVLKTPAATREVEIPAEYATVKVQRLVEPARTVRTPIPAEFQTVSREVLVTPAAAEWRQILCDTNANVEKVAQVQRALRAAGFDPGTVDGRFTTDTQRALADFQLKRGLPVDKDRYINVQTVRALGVEPK